MRKTLIALTGKDFMNIPQNPGRVKWLWRLLRVIMGGILIFASVEKIINPAQFAHAIFNYKLFPTGLINLLALVVPWLEFTVGIFLIGGIFEWASVTLYNGLMVVFMALIAISLARGLNISCGCFTSDPNAEKMTWITFFRDVIMLLPGLAAYPLLFRLRRPPFVKER
jgi:uncharacterized membrane protein YphA (DoxX/SURF4 family)